MTKLTKQTAAQLRANYLLHATQTRARLAQAMQSGRMMKASTADNLRNNAAYFERQAARLAVEV